MQLNTLTLSPIDKTLKDRLKTKVGDTIKIDIRIREGARERIQPFVGIVTSINNSGYSTTFTVRKTFQGIGVERVILPFSKKIAALTILQSARIRRAKLYYLRQRQGKAARLKQMF